MIKNNDQQIYCPLQNFTKMSLRGSRTRKDISLDENNLFPDRLSSPGWIASAFQGRTTRKHCAALKLNEDLDDERSFQVGLENKNNPKTATPFSEKGRRIDDDGFRFIVSNNDHTNHSRKLTMPLATLFIVVLLLDKIRTTIRRTEHRRPWREWSQNRPNLRCRTWL